MLSGLMPGRACLTSGYVENWAVRSNGRSWPGKRLIGLSIPDTLHVNRETSVKVAC